MISDVKGSYVNMEIIRKAQSENIQLSPSSGTPIRSSAASSRHSPDGLPALCAGNGCIPPRTRRPTVPPVGYSWAKKMTLHSVDSRGNILWSILCDLLERSGGMGIRVFVNSMMVVGCILPRCLLHYSRFSIHLLSEPLKSVVAIPSYLGVQGFR